MTNDATRDAARDGARERVLSALPKGTRLSQWETYIFDAAWQVAWREALATCAGERQDTLRAERQAGFEEALAAVEDIAHSWIHGGTAPEVQADGAAVMVALHRVRAARRDAQEG